VLGTEARPDKRHLQPSLRNSAIRFPYNVTGPAMEEVFAKLGKICAPPHTFPRPVQPATIAAAIT